MATEPTATKGIRKRIGVNGAITYEARVRPKDQPEIQKTFKRYEDALAWQREFNFRTGRGEKVSTRPDKIKIPDVASWFKETVPEKDEPKKKTSGENGEKKAQHGKTRTQSETARI